MLKVSPASFLRILSIADISIGASNGYHHSNDTHDDNNVTSKPQLPPVADTDLHP